MRHGVKKIRFSPGKDAKDMMRTKLVVNFIKRGKLITTIKRARALKQEIDKLVKKAKKNTQANRNSLLNKVGSWTITETMFNEVGPALKAQTGGYVKIIKLGMRESDGAEMGRVEWAYPVITSEKKKVEKIDSPAAKVEKVSSKKKA
jgi:large subunit ribosomal protein L17